MAKSSINFQKATGHSYEHNFRKDKPNYLLPKNLQKENEFWQHEKTAKEIFQDELKKITGVGKRPTFENSHWEAVLNLNENHNLEDVKKVAEHIEKKFNITNCAISIHRDEGYINDAGKVIYNYHAHLNFVTLKDEKQRWRKEYIKPSVLSELQTEVAELLNMERGEINSKAVRLEHKQYKAVAKEREYTKELEQENQQLKEKIKELEYSFRTTQKQITALENLSTEQKKELHRLNTATNKSKSPEQIEALYQKIEAYKKENEHLQSVVELKEIEIIDLKADNSSRTNESILNDKPINYRELEQNIAFKDDLDKNLSNHINEKELNIKTGVIKSEKQNFNIVDNKYNLRASIISTFTKSINDLYELAKEKAKKFYEDIIKEKDKTIEKQENEISQLKNKIYSRDRKISDLEKEIEKPINEIKKRVFERR